MSLESKVVFFEVPTKWRRIQGSHAAPPQYVVLHQPEAASNVFCVRDKENACTHMCRERERESVRMCKRQKKRVRGIVRPTTYSR
jgi:hypothetical protein